MNIHEDDIATWNAVRALADAAIAHFGLEVTAIEPKARPFADAAFGLWYGNDRRIAIQLRHQDRKPDGGKWWKTPLSFDVVLDTLAHELAHSKHDKHGANHKALTNEIRAYLKEKGK